MISRQEKKDAVEEIKRELKKSETIAIGCIAGLPSRQYNLVKKKTRAHASVIVARQTLLKRALEEARPDARELEKFFCNGAVLVLSDLDAFKLHRLFKQNKTKAFARPGALAPSDIIVPAGDTSLAPGPVLTELKQAKIEAKIQGTRVVISKDTVVARKGEAVSEPASKILAKLGIEPFEIGLEVKAVFDKGVLYEGSVLDVDDAVVFNNFVQAIRQAVALAVHAEFYNEVTAPLIVARAAREAAALEALVKQKTAPAPEPAAPAPQKEAKEAEAKPQDAQTTPEPAPAEKPQSPA